MSYRGSQEIDAHISIVGGMIITALIFMGFNYFKDIVKKEMTKSRLKKAWSLHFPFFDYEEYANKVNEIFEEAIYSYFTFCKSVEYRYLKSKIRINIFFKIHLSFKILTIIIAN